METSLLRQTAKVGVASISMNSPLVFVLTSVPVGVAFSARRIAHAVQQIRLDYRETNAEVEKQKLRAQVYRTLNADLERQTDAPVSSSWQDVLDGAAEAAFDLTDVELSDDSSGRPAT